MKKLLNIRVYALVIAALATSAACSQDLGMNTKTKNAPLAFNTTTATDNNAIAVDEINRKALRDFYRSYGEVTDARWTKTDNGYAVKFKKDGMSTVVFYTGRGAVDCIINYYSGEKLPENVRAIVRTTFYDYTISQVAEVHKNGVVAHVIKIEDKKTIKTIKVINGEYEVTEELTKR